MVKQSTGESTGTVKIATIRAYPTTIFRIPATPGKLFLALTWSSNDQLLLSLTGPAGHGLSGRIGLAVRNGTSPLQLERYLTSEEASKGPLEVEIRATPFAPAASMSSIRLKDGQLVATITPDEPPPTPTIDASDPSSWAAIRETMNEGRLLSKAEADLLEKRLPQNPDDLLARLSLLAFYSSRGRQLSDIHEVILQRRRQVVWLIEHEGSSRQIFSLPEAVPASADDVLYDPEGTNQARQLWTKLIDANPNDISLLKNAASFLMKADYDRSKALLLEGRRIRPGDDDWVGMLAQLYSTAAQGKSAAPSRKPTEVAIQAESELRSSTDPNLLATVAVDLATPKEPISGSPVLKFKTPPKIKLAEELANKAISLEPNQPVWTAALVNVLQMERSTAVDPKQRLSATRKMFENLQKIIESDPDQVYPAGNYSTLGVLALELDDVANAAKYSERALALATSSEFENDPSRAEAQHDSNSTLGRLALREKNIPAAKKALIKAGAASSVGTFDRQGPEMYLAQELLALGERQAVLDYLKDCEKLWPTGSSLLHDWSEEIQLGKTPHLNRVDGN